MLWFYWENIFSLLLKTVSSLKKKYKCKATATADTKINIQSCLFLTWLLLIPGPNTCSFLTGDTAVVQQLNNCLQPTSLNNQVFTLSRTDTHVLINVTCYEKNMMHSFLRNRANFYFYFDSKSLRYTFKNRTRTKLTQLLQHFIHSSSSVAQKQL